jgi:hypothetical protein
MANSYLRCDRHLEQTAAMVLPSVVIKHGMVGGGLPDISPGVLPLSEGERDFRGNKF